MNRTVVRSALAVAATTAVLLTSACSSDEPEEGTQTESAQVEATEDDTEEAAAPTGPVEVPDVTLLILATAQDNLGRVGLEATLVDETGAEVTADDPTTYLVTEQDPADGELEAGETVTLTVKPRD